MQWHLLNHQRQQCAEGFGHLLRNHCSPAHNNNDGSDNEEEEDNDADDNVDDEDKASLCNGAFVATIHLKDAYDYQNG